MPASVALSHLDPFIRERPPGGRFNRVGVAQLAELEHLPAQATGELS